MTVAAFPRVSITNNADRDPMRGFITPADYFGAVMDAGHGRRPDPRLAPLAVAGSDENGGYSDPFGGFLLPAALHPDPVSTTTEDPTLPCFPIPMTAHETTVPARIDRTHATSVSGGVVVYRLMETDAITPSRFQLDGCTLYANELAAITIGTQRVITDSRGAFLTVLNKSYRDERDGTITREKLHGRGVGEYLGVVRAGCTIAVSKETGQGAATILTENVETMEGRCWHYERAKWLAHPDTKVLLKKLTRTVGTGGAPVPLLTYAADGQPLLSGRPIFFTDQCAAVGTVGDIIAGCWDQYLEGTLYPAQTTESIHVRFQALESVFRFLERGDGQPWWKAPLTLRNSTSTVSPFVVLETRA